MKHIYLAPIVILFLILTSCGASIKSDPVRSFIPGVYAKKINNEFSTGNDTLVISVLSQQGNTYQIVRKTSFQRILDGKTKKMEMEIENWTATYNEQEKLLHETKRGKLISFNPEQGSLMVGSSEYKKVE